MSKLRKLQFSHLNCGVVMQFAIYQTINLLLYIYRTILSFTVRSAIVCNLFSVYCLTKYTINNGNYLH